MSLENLHRLSELTGIGYRTIKARLSGLTPTQEGKALLYESKEALPLLYRVGTDQEALNPQVERALLDRERRKALELANAKTTGDLLPREDVAKAWSDQIAIAKARLLALPGRMAPAVLRLKDMRSVEKTLRDGIYTILEELAAEASTYRPSDRTPDGGGV